MIINNTEHLQNIAPAQNTFYRAVVENNDDSKEVGEHQYRVQVRILGIHTEEDVLDNLPWAEVQGGVDFLGGNSGIGVSSTILKGTWVWVFLDAGDFNKPVVTGVIKGINSRTKSLKLKGFKDPDSVYPLEDNLSDVNRLSINKELDKTIVKLKKDTADKGIPTVTKTWIELPEKNSSTVYPNNTVYQTPGGSVIEYDSTPGNERIHFFHKSGTYFEIQDNGDYQRKVTGMDYSISNKDKYSLVKNDFYSTVFGNSELKFDGTKETFIGDTSKVTVKGNVTEIYKSNKDETVTGSVTEKYGKQIVDGGSEITMTAGVINLN